MMGIKLFTPLFLVLLSVCVHSLPRRDVLTNEIPSTLSQHHTSVESSKSKEEPIDRKEFITGHRIPLELFSQATLERIELTEELRPGREYVDSSNFRSVSGGGGSALDALGEEVDPAYERTLDSFVPTLLN
eukprot:TRINITY_DN25637_c0_g1_i1.p1 TRINITY_DN25637_c0_g1~~TRINITY_DN25637_c0_g1_i1.p1  ORF type:complete len:131 (+),score=41.23 TRINITY_DN25637_c0_g1_i1:233-625(+)